METIAGFRADMELFDLDLEVETTVLLPCGKRPWGHLPDIQKAFSQTLQDYRSKRHLTQKQLAVQLGVAETTLRLWEQGKTIPHPSTRLRAEKMLKE